MSTIAEMGTTGISTGRHLHQELRYLINPNDTTKPIFLDPLSFNTALSNSGKTVEQFSNSTEFKNYLIRFRDQILIPQRAKINNHKYSMNYANKQINLVNQAIRNLQ